MLVEVGVKGEWGTDAWGLSVVRELQDVDHVFALLLADVVPGYIGHVLQRLAHGIVVVSAPSSIDHHCGWTRIDSLPAHAFQNRVRPGQRF